MWPTHSHDETRSRQEIWILSEAGATSLTGPDQALSPPMASVSSSAQGHTQVGWPHWLLSLLNVSGKLPLAVNSPLDNTHFSWCACLHVHADPHTRTYVCAHTQIIISDCNDPFYSFNILSSTQLARVNYPSSQNWARWHDIRPLGVLRGTRFPYIDPIITPTDKPRVLWVKLRVPNG